MPSKSKGSIRLFHALGVDVFLHWSWFLVAAYEIQSRSGRYSSVLWNALEYLSLFLIVLLHEFGHAIACRQVGGTANRIILWPMGGVAFVNPPQRAGATLWSIAAGPLVNVALLPALIFATWMSRRLGWMISHHDLYVLLRHILGIDIVLLLFNMLPVFPLDGGQILRSLLWFVMGRGRSLMVVAVLGFVGVLGFAALAVWMRSVWTGAVVVYMAVSCWSGFKAARVLMRLDKMPRRVEYACPMCGKSPQVCTHWICDQCREKFDPFGTHGLCPGCGVQHSTAACLDCHASTPMETWAHSHYAATEAPRFS
jgi:Zn-dependent protease